MHKYRHTKHTHAPVCTYLCGFQVCGVGACMHAYLLASLATYTYILAPTVLRFGYTDASLCHVLLQLLV